MEPLQMVDLKAQYRELKTELDAALNRVLETQHFIMGPEVAQFEGELAEFLGGVEVIGCASGTDALWLALKALGVGPGDEVITTPFTFAATAEVIVLLGAKPVYVDIDPVTYNLDVSQVEAAINSRTKVLLPVHLYGQPAELDPILELARRQDLKVVEDAAQALGAYYHGKPVGTLGDIGCTSFFPAKNLGGFGDGGAVFTRDPQLAREVRLLHTHGSQKRYYHERVGLNSRLDALQAAVLRVKLKRLAHWNEIRARRASEYARLLADLPVVTPETAPDRTHIFQQYTIRVSRRDALQAFLKDRGIPTAVHYPRAIFQQPAFRDSSYDARCPQAVKSAQEVLSLPMHPHLTAEQVEWVAEAIKEFYRS